MPNIPKQMHRLDLERAFREKIRVTIYFHRRIKLENALVIKTEKDEDHSFDVKGETGTVLLFGLHEVKNVFFVKDGEEITLKDYDPEEELKDKIQRFVDRQDEIGAIVLYGGNRIYGIKNVQVFPEGGFMTYTSRTGRKGSQPISCIEFVYLKTEA